MPSSSGRSFYKRRVTIKNDCRRYQLGNLKHGDNKKEAPLAMRQQGNGTWGEIGRDGSPDIWVQGGERLL